MDENDKLNALAVHLLLDPEVQAKLFRVLAQGLREGFVRTPTPEGGELFDRGPVKELLTILRDIVEQEVRKHKHYDEMQRRILNPTPLEWYAIRTTDHT